MADASSLVAELVRRRGVELVLRPELRLVVAAHAWSETLHELPRRTAAMARRGVDQTTAEGVLHRAIATAVRRIAVVPVETYAAFEAEARRRLPGDPDDWPTVAAALALNTAIWTNDRDFLGCGVATWTTETLLLQLA